MLRALEDGGNRRLRLRGCEFAGLPRLRRLVLNCIDCPHGGSCVASSLSPEEVMH